MPESELPAVAIVDCGMGNLFSIKHALAYVGVPSVVTSSKKDVLAANAVILPGVGSFGDAMASLHRLDLVEPVREVAASDKLLVGICLGMQLLMSESYEFGTHKGLDIFPGAVVPFVPSLDDGARLKVPNMGWTRVFNGSPEEHDAKAVDVENEGWRGTPMEGLRNGEYQYFVHSYYAEPEDDGIANSVARYGDTTFCSSLWRNRVFGCQFHPERSGPRGLKIYQNLASMLAPVVPGGADTWRNG